MSRRISSALRLTLAATFMASVPLSVARAADVVAPGPYVDAGPDSYCARAGHLRSIQRRFGIQAREVHLDPGLAIVAISDFRENRYLPIAEDIRSVERLYCRATASMSDGASRTLWYLIEYGEGFAGVFGDNVEFCLSGLDRWNVYDGHCRVVQ